MNLLREFMEISSSSSSNSSNSSSSGSSISSSTSSSSSSVESEFSSDNDENHDILFPILQILLHGRKRHRVENFIEVVHSWTNAEFKEHLRLQRVIAVTLVGMRTVDR